MWKAHGRIIPRPRRPAPARLEESGGGILAGYRRKNRTSKLLYGLLWQSITLAVPMDKITQDDALFMESAIEEARQGFAEGGIPIGSVLVLDGRIVGRGRNRRKQQSNPILHGEMDCLQSAGRLTAKDYQRSTLYSTLSPCHMCAGAILLFGIRRVVMAENRTFQGAEELMHQHDVEVVNMDLAEPRQLMQEFIARHPKDWAEDIAE